MSQERATQILKMLRRARPGARVELAHDSPFRLLVATILSAQCTDARVNLVTPSLFRAWPDARALAGADPRDVEEAIRSTGFFRAKTRSLKAMSQALLDRHGGEVPRTMDEMTRLPGVGRKTANVVLGAGYGIASGIVVDTHAARVAQRLGLTRESDPVRIERDLMAVIPREDWIFASIALVLHGRYVCQARLPRCSECPLSPHCPSRHLEAELRAGKGRGVKARPTGKDAVRTSRSRRPSARRRPAVLRTKPAARRPARGRS
jgi:endonuclease-3